MNLNEVLKKVFTFSSKTKCLPLNEGVKGHSLHIVTALSVCASAMTVCL